MKKTVFKESQYSVAMSKETGCLVMLRTNGQKVTILGSLERDDSVQICQALMQWQAPAVIESRVN